MSLAFSDGGASSVGSSLEAGLRVIAADHFQAQGDRTDLGPDRQPYGKGLLGTTLRYPYEVPVDAGPRRPDCVAGHGAMNPFIALAGAVLPDILKAVVGDKAGTVAGAVTLPPACGSSPATAINWTGRYGRARA